MQEIMDRFSTPDFLKRRDFLVGKRKGCMVFQPDLSTGQDMGEMLKAIHLNKEEVDSAEFFIERVLFTREAEVKEDLDEIINLVLNGDVAIILDGIDGVIVANARGWNLRGIGEPPTEGVVRGPREGFVEDLRTNLSLIQRKLKTPNFALERMKIGRNSNTNIALVYLSNVADPKIVNEIKERLKKIDLDAIVDSYNLEPFLEYRPHSIFKQVGYTERPDIAVSKLSEGRVLIIVDGSPIVLTLPFILIEDLKSPEDYYGRSAVSTFLRVLRFVAITLAIVLPGFYVAMLQFNYDLTPLKVLVTIMNSIAGTPFTPIIEMLLMIFLFELIRESSVRMPRLVSMAMGIVSGIVLGEAVARMGLISLPTILITAASSIALFVIPNYIGTSTLLRIVFTLVGGLLGLWGILLGLVFLIHYLAGMDSYGAPYLAPLAPLIPGDLNDSIMACPIIESKKRPKSCPNINENRQG